MPIGELHKRKFKKNMAVLAMIVGFCALVAAITMIKISANKAQTAALTQTASPASPNAVE
jgi:hypothetical protein